MARILVADDNSNVQRTVTLALAGLGIEVTAVNNGEAAVRKLPDLMPDLVLADIFMPVRNGYEVCEYVKRDTRFSHIPVVLLAGAFDPFDEREAQRVSADGILKKPFVPPDPLVTMVKTLLDRIASERLVPVSISKSKASAESKPALTSTPQSFSPSEIQEEPMEPAIHVAPVAFGEGERPVAFGALFDSPSATPKDQSALIEPVDEDQVLTSSRDATLGEPVFWRNDSEADAPEPETPEFASANLIEHSPEFKKDTQFQDEVLPVKQAEVEEPLELVRDEHEVLPTTLVANDHLELDPARYASLNVSPERAPELAASPLDWLATAPERGEHASDDPSNAYGSRNGSLLSEPVDDGTRYASDEDLSPVKNEVKNESSPVDSHGEPAVEFTPAPEEPARSIPVLEWPSEKTISETALPSVRDSADQADCQFAEIHAETEVQAAAPAALPITDFVSRGKESVALPDDTAPSIAEQTWTDLSQSLDTSVAETEKEREDSSSVVEIPTPFAPLTTSAKGSSEPTPEVRPVETAAATSMVSPDDTARSIPKGDWIALTNAIQTVAHEVALESVAPGESAEQLTPTAPVKPDADVPPAAASEPDPALVEAVVQKILAKMQPQVVDMITREFLRPAVQALVHREIEKQ